MTATTIAAVATPPGKGGVGILRVSGPDALKVGRVVTRKPDSVSPRYAYYQSFYASSGQVLDQGLLIYFKSPYSFTGEEVVELHAHGGPVVLDLLLKACLDAGAQLAKPGEFSERAFLNDKIDLIQAEAIADLIDASSEHAARCAVRTLSGGFSEHVNGLFEELVRIRVQAEACLDFPDEEVEDITSKEIKPVLIELINTCEACINVSFQGSLITNGIDVVIVGEPNVGKSSLLNSLSGQDRAIVTEISGTTRDVLKETILIDGILVNIIDTAGLRDTKDLVEQEGIRRANDQAKQADVVLFIVDAQNFKPEDIQELKSKWKKNWFSESLDIPDQRVVLIVNKIDLCDEISVQKTEIDGFSVVYMSVLKGLGIEYLKESIKDVAGVDQGAQFSARRRHLDALEKTLIHLNDAFKVINQGAVELVAEELRLAQLSLEALTGTFRSDDLLGEIFSTFCMGK